MSSRLYQLQCWICGAGSETAEPLRRYCGTTHQRRAAVLRRRGERLPFEPSGSCLWCGRDTAEGAPACSPRHAAEVNVCQRKLRFLSAEAAAAIAGVRSSPGVGRTLEPYQCPAPLDEPHWHLYTIEKRSSKRRQFSR